MFRLCAAVLLVLVAAAGITRWIKASDHKDSALLAADHAADIADVYTFRSPVHPDNVVLVMTVSGFIPPSEASNSVIEPRHAINRLSAATSSTPSERTSMSSTAFAPRPSAMP